METKYEEEIYTAHMAVSRGFYCIVEQNNTKTPALVCSWWAGGWLVSLVFHSLQ